MSLKATSDIKELKNILDSGNYKPDETLMYVGDLEESLEDYTVNCNFMWSNVFNIRSTAKGLPRVVKGCLTIQNITLNTCEGMSEYVGGLYMDASCFVDSWVGLNDTFITTNSYVNRLSLPKKHDIIFHPHSQVKLTRLIGGIPYDITNYRGSDIYHDYLKDKEKFNEYLSELLFEDLCKNLLETI